MTCIAPRCGRPGHPFCGEHAIAPAGQRGGWLSAYRRRAKMVGMGTAATPMEVVTIDASRTIERLWIGARPPADRRLPSFTMVVLCAAEYQPERTSWDGRIVRVPMRDDEPTQTEIIHAVTAARTVAEEVRRGGRALVTCYAGLNRSAWVASMAALILRPRMKATEAIILARHARGPNALSNPHFEGHLRKLFASRDR